MPRRIEDAVKAANRSDSPSRMQPEGKLVAEAYQRNGWTAHTASTIAKS